MNPYYAHDSAVGPVFDVAKFSHFKAVAMGLSGLVFAAIVGATALYVWDPTWLVPEPPQIVAELNQEIDQLWKDYPQGTQYGVIAAGLVAGFFVVAACSYLYQAFTVEMYIRVGEGGMSFRVAQGFKALEVDLPWDEIESWTVTQEKQLGSLSRNTGNLSGNLSIRTYTQGKYHVSLDDFREPAYLIFNRIQEASEMRPANLEVPC